MTDNLSYEIIKRILADVGATSGKLFGKVGLTDTALKLDKQVVVRYDDRDRKHDVYSGKISLGDSSKIYGLLINLSIDGESEFLFLFRMDNLPIHAVRVIYDNSADSFFKIYDSEKTVWREANIYAKARVLADFERLVSWGAMWEDYIDIKDLYDAAISLIR